MSEMPQYRVLEPSFFAPDLIEPGSIIATNAPPGPHLEPWNEAGRVAMNAWLDEEHDEIDIKTGLKTGKKIRPHAKYRRAEYSPSEQQTAQVLEAPEPTDAMGQTLAELTRRKNTDQRPPPARQFKRQSPVEDTPEPTALVVKAAPKDTTVTGGPGGN